MKLMLITFSFLISFTLEAKNCFENRMGVDIGSGSTKILVAQIDVCNKTIIKVLLQESKAAAYNDNFEKSADGSITPEMETKGFSVLKELIELSRIHKPKKTSGVATSVFRKANNGKQIIARFSKKLKISLKVISQDEEAQLGYDAAVATLGAEASGLLGEKRQVVVWDIGGGSMQMITRDDKKNFLTYLGSLASNNFKNMIIEVFQQKPIETTPSPNPIGLSRTNVVALARAYARLHVPPQFVNKERDKVYVGVGGVHNQSIKTQLQLKGSSYSVGDLDDLAIQQAQKSDKDLTGDYRATDVSNLLLVQGFMEAMSVREVNLVNASLLQGLLIQ